MSWPLSQRQQFHICAVKKCKVLGLRKVAFQEHSHTASCPHELVQNYFNNILVITSGVKNFLLSISAYKQITFSCSLQVIWATNTGICYLEARREINIYKWLSCSCTHAICMCLSTVKCTHISYIYRMFVCVQWLTFSTPIYSDAHYMKNVCFLFLKLYETSENLKAPASLQRVTPPSSIPPLANS